MAPAVAKPTFRLRQGEAAGRQSPPSGRFDRRYAGMMIRRSLFILGAAVFGVLLLIVAVPLAPPLLNWLTYDPQACAAYSKKNIADYVSADLSAGRSVCSISKPQSWSNDHPADVIICDGERRSVERAEVYPDCGIEHRPVGR